MSQYGDLPTALGRHVADCREFMFFQDMPIKLAGQTELAVEPRLACFREIIGVAACDYVGLRGLDSFVESYVYVIAKRMYHGPGYLMNRPGWHSDGFMTDDTTYAWTDCAPTVFNSTNFSLTPDDSLSMREMERQALPKNNVTHLERTLLRMDQFVVHRVATVSTPMLRTFLKVTFSRDQFNLLGNSHNHLLDYDWPMYERTVVRNMPQKVG